MTFSISSRLSSLDCVSGWYGSLGMIPGLIWKRSCINLYILICVHILLRMNEFEELCQISHPVLWRYVHKLHYFLFISVFRHIHDTYSTNRRGKMLLWYSFNLYIWFVYLQVFFQTFIHYFCTISNIFKQRRKQDFSLWITHLKKRTSYDTRRLYHYLFSL